MRHSSMGEPSRRHFLRGVGVTLALPWMESVARTAEPTAGQRFVCVANPFGMVADAFFPTEEGLAAALPANLAPLEPLRGKFTVFSNLDHGTSGGHGLTHTFLSGVKSSEASSMPDGNVSLDQFLARSVAGQTRLPVVNTAAGPAAEGSVELCWTRTGVAVPPMMRVSQVFRKLFVSESAEQAAKRGVDYARKDSILDAVTGQAARMNRRLSGRDRAKLDQYFTAIREVEKSIAMEKDWLSKPRPHVDAKEPTDGPVTQQLPILFDLVALALETDTTRVATVEIPGSFDAKAVGVGAGHYHGLSHHGKDPTLMDGLRKVEHYQLLQLAKFLTKLDKAGLLDTTQVLFGSGMGDGSAHTNKNLPVLLAGGGYRHRTHVILPTEAGKRIPLSNLYLSMARRFGVETDSFGKSTGTFGELS
jgi:hypothetical protein